MKKLKVILLALAAIALLVPTVVLGQSENPAAKAQASKKAGSAQSTTAKGSTSEVPSQVQQTLIALDKQWGEAAGKGDTATLSKVLSDKFVGIGDKGQIVGKQEQLAATAPASNVQNTSYTADEYKFESLAPNVILMTHRATTKGTQDGKEVTESHRSLHVLQKNGGQWQVVANAQLPIKD